MRPRTVTFLALLFAACAAAPASLSTLTSARQQPDPARTEGPQQGAPGALLILDPKTGAPAGACPLRHTDVRAEISGFVARVTVTQEFENPLKEQIEAV